MAKCFRVTVGNIGEVYNGPSATEAKKTFSSYVESSKSSRGKASGQDVALFDCSNNKTDELKEYYSQPVSKVKTETDSKRPVSRNASGKAAPGASKAQFIKENKKELDAAIHRVSPNVSLNNEDREAWIDNDEGIYSWYRIWARTSRLRRNGSESVSSKPAVENPAAAKQKTKYKVLTSTSKNATYEGYSFVNATAAYNEAVKLNGSATISQLDNKSNKWVVLFDYKGKKTPIKAAAKSVTNNSSGSKQKERGTRDFKAKNDAYSQFINSAESERTMAALRRARSKSMTIEDHKLSHWDDLNDAKAARKLLPNSSKSTAYCLKCKEQVKPLKPKTVVTEKGMNMLKGVCPACQAHVCKLLGKA